MAFGEGCNLRAHNARILGRWRRNLAKILCLIVESQVKSFPSNDDHHDTHQSTNINALMNESIALIISTVLEAKRELVVLLLRQLFFLCFKRSMVPSPKWSSLLALILQGWRPGWLYWDKATWNLPHLYYVWTSRVLEAASPRGDVLIFDIIFLDGTCDPRSLSPPTMRDVHVWEQCLQAYLQMSSYLQNTKGRQQLLDPSTSLHATSATATKMAISSVKLDDAKNVISNKDNMIKLMVVALSLAIRERNWSAALTAGISTDSAVTDHPLMSERQWGMMADVELIARDLHASLDQLIPKEAAQ
jgi:hypothetical protein